MPQPDERHQERAVRHMRDAVEALRMAGIGPLARPRVLAAARALGYPLALDDWYAAAWALERAGEYRRAGNGESEWLEPARPAEAATAADPFDGRPWLAGALRTEFERTHDSAALAALAAALRDTLPAEAERCLRAVCELDPHDTGALLALARLLNARGDGEHAAIYAERLVLLAPENADAQVLLGNILDDRGQRGLAREYFRRAIELAPSHAAAHFNYGVLLLRDNRRAQAERHLRRAL